MIIVLFITGCESKTGTNNNRVFIFDEMIEEDQVEIELYQLILNAKRRIYFKNFPSLNIQHSINNPDLLIDLLTKMKRRGVDIKLIHIAKRGMYPLTKHLFLNGIRDIEQNGESYNYGVLGDKAKYAIIDDQVLVLYDPNDYPRIIGLEVEKNDIREDFEYTWKYIQQIKKDNFR